MDACAQRFRITTCSLRSLCARSSHRKATLGPRQAAFNQIARKRVDFVICTDRPYEGLKYAGDARGAVFLAPISRLGLLPEGYIYPSEERGLRDLALKRMRLVQQRTLIILSIESIRARQINVHLNAEQVRHLDIEAVTKLQLPAHTECAMMADLAVLCTLLPGSWPPPKLAKTSVNLEWFAIAHHVGGCSCELLRKRLRGDNGHPLRLLA